MTTIATTTSPTLAPATYELERQLRALRVSGYGANTAGQEPGGDRQPPGLHRVPDAAGRRRIRAPPRSTLHPPTEIGQSAATEDAGELRLVVQPADPQGTIPSLRATM